MIKRFILIIAIFILAIFLVCCSDRNLSETEMPEISDISQISEQVQTEKIEYIKIAQQEAHDMMTGDVIILDVRTQAEFDSGHIINAVLLPDYEIKEKAESVLPDKNQTILIYCRTGIRSANAARDLIEIGYTKVFDFGGIVDWEYEIVND